MARRVARRGVACAARVWLPPRCLVCGAPGLPGQDLCAACDARLLRPDSIVDGRRLCIGCGDPIPACAAASFAAPTAAPMAGATRCGPCNARPPQFVSVVVPWRYAAPVDGWVGELKHRGRKPLARLFGEVLAREVRRVSEPSGPLSAAPVDALLPVPLHPARQRARGFNQSELIARWAGRALTLPVLPHAARRIIDTGSLAERSRAERRLAILGAFQVDEAVVGRHVALIDDVLTSGATTSELARECLDGGAAAVSLWAVARTAA